METSPPSAHAKSRIVFLDYLRIFAFVSVLVGHKFSTYLVPLSNDPTVHSSVRTLASWVLPLVTGGGVGVVVFFLVSGYIITHVLQSEVTTEFLVKRAFRIYPLYFVAVLMEYTMHVLYGSPVSIGALISQLLLIGDLFNTPPALAGVEWTLRVEVMFYLIMAAARAGGLMTHARRWLPLAFTLLIVLAAVTDPVPNTGSFTHGYLTIYGPFLFVGAMFYLYQMRTTTLSWLLLISAIALVQYYRLIPPLHPVWATADFAAPALAIFWGAWFFRDHLGDARIVRLLSDLTYSVYLFHNWFFESIKVWLSAFGVNVLPPGVQALIVLLLFCYAVVRLIEKPAIRLGRKVYSALSRRRAALQESRPASPQPDRAASESLQTS